MTSTREQAKSSSRGSKPASSDTAGLLRRIAALLYPYHDALIVAFGLMIVAAGVIALAPFLTKAVFDDALFPASGRPDLGLLTWLAIGLIAIVVVGAGIGLAHNLLTSRVANATIADLRNSLFKHMQRMDIAFFTASKAGAVQTRLTSDVNGARTALTSTAPAIVANVVTLIASLIAMFILSWQLAIVALILMAVFIAMQVLLGRSRRRMVERNQESLAEVTTANDERLTAGGLLLAKVFNQSSLESMRYSEGSHRQANLQTVTARINQSYVALVGVPFAIAPAVTFLVAGHLLGSNPGLTVGTLVAVTILQVRMLVSLMQLTRTSQDVPTSLAWFRHVFAYLDLTPAVRESPIAIALDPSTARGDVELRDVWFAYPEAGRVPDGQPADDAGSLLEGDHWGATAGGMEVAAQALTAGVPEEDTVVDAMEREVGEAFRWALSAVSIHVMPGQFAAIVGPPGSGKTTLTYLIPRFHDAGRGVCLIDGMDVRDVTLSSLADVVGVVTQDPYVFHGTIRDNLAYARPDATQSQIEQAARDANIHDRVKTFDRGYDTVVGERGYQLTGAEKQLLAIARVLLRNPRVLVLDEATSALDAETERLVQDAIRRATRDRTTIAIAHRLSTILAADVIFGLDNGRIVEQGTHAELLAHGGLYWRLYTEEFGAGQVEARLYDGVKFTDGSVMAGDRGHHLRTDVQC